MRPTALLLTLFCASTPGAAWAAPDDAGSTDKGEGAYLTVNVGVEMHAIERSAAEVARSLDQLAGSVAKLAESPSLSEEDKTELLAVIARVDTLSDRVVRAIDRLPDAVEESRKPLTEIASELATKVRLTVIIVLVLLLLVILGALWGVYTFVLKPSGAMVAAAAGRIIGLTDSLERAAELVAQTNVAQVELTRTLEAHRAGLNVAPPVKPTEPPDPPEPVAPPA